MKRSTIMIIATLFVVSFFYMAPVDAATGIHWSFEEGDILEFRFISDGLVDDEIISFRIDSPLPEWCEVPPDTYDISALDNWMEIPFAPVTVLIPFGSSTTEVDDFEDVFTYGGLAAGYWCRFSVPTGESNDTYAPLIERWSSGPHGAIEPKMIQVPRSDQYRYWGFEYGFEFSDTIYNVTALYLYDDNYLSNLTIVGHDSSTGARTHYMMMVTDVHPPTIGLSGGLNFRNLTLGTIGEEILWNVHDHRPCTYEVYKDETLILSGECESFNEWVHVTLDGLEVGVYNYTIVATDFLWHTVSDTVIVTVTGSSPIATDLLLIIGGVGAVVIVGIIIAKRR